jgi:hypothetical protein
LGFGQRKFSLLAIQRLEGNTELKSTAQSKLMNIRLVSCKYLYERLRKKWSELCSSFMRPLLDFSGMNYSQLVRHCSLCPGGSDS